MRCEYADAGPRAELLFLDLEDRQLVRDRRRRVAAVVVPARPAERLDADRPQAGRRRVQPHAGLDTAAAGVADRRVRRGPAGRLALGAIRVAPGDDEQLGLRERGLALPVVHADRHARHAAAADVHRQRRQDGQRERRRRLGEPVGYGADARRRRDVQLPQPLDRADKPALTPMLRRGAQARG